MREEKSKAQGKKGTRGFYRKKKPTSTWNSIFGVSRRNDIVDCRPRKQHERSKEEGEEGIDSAVEEQGKQGVFRSVFSLVKWLCTWAVVVWALASRWLKGVRRWMASVPRSLLDLSLPELVPVEPLDGIRILGENISVVLRYMKGNVRRFSYLQRQIRWKFQIT